MPCRPLTIDIIFCDKKSWGHADRTGDSPITEQLHPNAGDQRQDQCQLSKTLKHGLRTLHLVCISSAKYSDLEKMERTLLEGGEICRGQNEERRANILGRSVQIQTVVSNKEARTAFCKNRYGHQVQTNYTWEQTYAWICTEQLPTTEIRKTSLKIVC